VTGPASPATESRDVGERPERLARVRTAMRERSLRALLLAAPEDVYWLTGLNHQGHFALTALVVGADGGVPPVLVLREMERPTVQAQVSGAEMLGYLDDADPADAVVAALRRVADRGRMGVDRDSMALPPRAWEAVRTGLPAVRWADARELMVELRAVKSAAEIEHVRRAAAISDRAISAAIASAAPGVSEREIAAALYRELIAAGSDHPGFVPLVRSGPTLGHEHVTWGDRRLAAGDTLFLELSGAVARYHAPVSRLVFITRPPEGIERSARAVAAGMEEIRLTLRPGALAGDVYAGWQLAINDVLGHDRHRRHHCGYLVGIGFPPSWSGGGTPLGLRSGSTLEIRSGMTFHAISWVLHQEVPDFGISDTALVTDDGCELLTTTRRDPLVVGD
jgi:Xaa-Pro dipeptidase